MTKAITYPEQLFGKEIIKKYCGHKNAPMHPNRISAIVGVSTFIGSILIQNPYSFSLGLPMIIMGDTFADYYDGKYARNYNLSTKEGSKLDPLFDKIKNISIGTSVAIAEGITNPLTLAFGASILVDGISQRQRGPILEQLIEANEAVKNPENCTLDTEKKSNLRANNYGKWKTGIQAGVHIAYGVSKGVEHFVHDDTFLYYSNNFFDYAMPTALGISAILGCVGVYQRIKN